MANLQNEQPTVSTGMAKVNASRYLRGTSFLGLEHTFYMGLVTVLPLVVLGALGTAFSMWTSQGTDFATAALMPSAMGVASLGSLGAMMAVWYAAALLVLVPAMWVLSARTHAELAKRPGFTQRLAYRLPLYASLGTLAAIALGLKVLLVSTIIYSILAIGTGVNIGQLYLYQFLPSLAALGVVCLVGMYVWRLAQGQDRSRRFNMLSLVIAAALAGALLITAAYALHDNGTNLNGGPGDVKPAYPDYKELDKYLNQQY